MVASILLAAVVTSASLFSISLAAPLESRASATSSSKAPSCTSLGKGPLGFNYSSIGIYNPGTPGKYLTFYGTQSNRYNDNYLLAKTPSSSVPEFFELFSCKYYAPKYQGKGSIEVYEGFIKTSDGNCIAHTTVDSSEGQFSKKPCAYPFTDLSGASNAQHFEFTLDSFYDFYSVVFLGQEKGPSPNANTSFGSGGQYKYNLATIPSTSPPKQFIEVDSYPGKDQPSNSSHGLMAQLGNQYQTDPKTFPECTSVKNGSLSLVDAKGKAHPVSLTKDGYGLVPVLNGTQSTNSFEFFQCYSKYMGYTNDENNHFGHLKTSQDKYSSDCFSRETNDPYDPNAFTNVVASQSSFNNACGTNDDSAQLSSYFRWFAPTGKVTFLGARSQRFPDDPTWGWTLQDKKIILTNTTSPYTLKFN